MNVCTCVCPYADILCSLKNLEHVAIWLSIICYFVDAGNSAEAEKAYQCGSSTGFQWTHELKNTTLPSCSGKHLLQYQFA